MATNRGVLDWTVEINDEGHRTYNVDWLVQTGIDDGPVDLLLAGAVPPPGSPWSPDGDSPDLWAFATPYLRVKRHEGKQGEKGRFWALTQKYTTMPVSPEKQRCNDGKIEDPLLEPQKVSGGFTKYTEEATHDRFGAPILNSAFELIRGQTVEFDKNRPTVKVEQNVPYLGVELFAPMVDTLNDGPLWGLDARKIKLDNVSWERKYYGLCSVYYTRTLEFSIRYDGFDREIADEGTKALNGDWSAAGGGWKVLPVKVVKRVATFANSSLSLNFAGGTDGMGIGMTVEGTGIPAGATVTDVFSGYILISAVTTEASTGSGNQITVSTPANPNNPAHFIRMKDKNGENMRVVLNGAGVPWDPGGFTTGTGDDLPGSIYVEKYGESNFLLLGIPLIL